MTISKKDIDIFLDTFDKLSSFEATHRMIRGYALFDENQLKTLSPVCKKVLDWLKKIDDKDLGNLNI